MYYSPDIIKELDGHVDDFVTRDSEGKITSIHNGQFVQQLHGRELSFSILTVSGIFFWPLQPRRDEVRLKDISHGISKECRFGNQIDTHMSVAEHAWRLSYHVPEHLRQWALIHDNTEAYIRDLPRPIKRQMTEFAIHESRLSVEISHWAGLNGEPEPEELKPYDMEIGQVEMMALHGSPAVRKLLALGKSATYLDRINQHYGNAVVATMNKEEAESAWLNRFREIFPNHAEVQA